MHPRPTYGPSQRSGRIIIQGMANGRSNIADSPESAGFFEATKKIHAKTAMARSRNNPATARPPRERLKTGFRV